MELAPLGEKHLLLLVGGYDLNIHVYLVPRIPSCSYITTTFKYKFSLQGHVNALRSFAFSEDTGNNIRYMASCG